MRKACAATVPMDEAGCASRPEPELALCASVSVRTCAPGQERRQYIGRDEGRIASEGSPQARPSSRSQPFLVGPHTDTRQTLLTHTWQDGAVGARMERHIRAILPVPDLAPLRPANVNIIGGVYDNASNLAAKRPDLRPNGPAEICPACARYNFKLQLFCARGQRRRTACLSSSLSPNHTGLGRVARRP